MKIVACLLALTALASAQPDKPEVIRWDAFPGPEAAAPARVGEVFAVCPVEGVGSHAAWGGRVDFVVAPIVAATPKTVTVRVLPHRFEVPAVFASAVDAMQVSRAPLAVGSYVRFEEPLAHTETPLVFGRIVKSSDDGYTVWYDRGHSLGLGEDERVSPLLAIPLDGTLRFGAPVSFVRGRERAFAWYIGPGHERDTSWVVSDGRAAEEKGIKPLAIAPFKKGAKVIAAFGSGRYRTQPLEVLEHGTVVGAVEHTLDYEVRADEGPYKGTVQTVAGDRVFAR